MSSSTTLPAHRSVSTPAYLTQYQQPKDQILVEKYIDLFSHRLQTNSESMDDHMELGNLYRSKRQFRQAFLIHRNLLARPHLSKIEKSKIYAELGYDYLYSQTKDYGEAYFQESLKLQKKFMYALEGLYQCYRTQQKLQKAMDVLTHMIKISPDKKPALGRLYNELAMLAVQENNLSLAKKWHKKASGFAKTPFYTLTKIQIDIACKHYEEAIEGFVDMIISYPAHASFPISKLENLLFEIGQYDRFFQTLSRCVQQSPNNAAVHHGLARYYEKTKQSEKAALHYEKAVESDTTNIQVFRDAMLFFQKHDVDNIPPVLNSFLGGLMQTKRYRCQSCTKTFEKVPSDCKTCHGWNLFDVSYTLRR